MSALTEHDPILTAYQLCEEVPYGVVLANCFKLFHKEGTVRPHPCMPIGFIGVVSGVKVDEFPTDNLCASLLVQESDPEMVIWTVTRQPYWHLNKSPKSWLWNGDDPDTIGTWVAGKHTLDGKLLTSEMREQYSGSPWRHTILPQMPEALRGRDLLDPRLHLFVKFTRHVSWKMLDQISNSHLIALNAHFPSIKDWQDKEPKFSVNSN